MSQLTFTWSPRASYAPEDFIAGQANQEALSLLENWPLPGQSPIALISGPESCGKTHLAKKWAAWTDNVTFIESKQLGKISSEALWQDGHYAVLEEIEKVADETALFHLIRYAETHTAPLLLTSRLSSCEFPFTLPDLTSRLLALPAAVIHEPDEKLFKAFLFKCFTDRQLRVGEEVADYLARRIERSFPSGIRAVAAIEKYAQEKNRPVTVPLVRSMIL